MKLYYGSEIEEINKSEEISIDTSVVQSAELINKQEPITPGLEKPHKKDPNSMKALSGGKILRYGSDIAKKPKKKVPDSKIASSSKKDY